MLLTPLFATLMTLCCFPTWPLESKRTLILPSPPGTMGVLENSGVVQPHDALTWFKIRGSSPVLVKVKVCSTISPSVTIPKSNASSATSKLALDPVAAISLTSELSCDSLAPDPHATKHMMRSEEHRVGKE